MIVDRDCEVVPARTAGAGIWHRYRSVLALRVVKTGADRSRTLGGAILIDCADPATCDDLVAYAVLAGPGADALGVFGEYLATW